MRAFQALVWTMLPSALICFNPFRATIKSKPPPQIEDRNHTPLHELPSDVNLNELLDHRSRKPEVYTRAMVELKRLEEQPLCHRMAAQLLLNNCRGLENVDEENFQWDSVHLQRHHVESFSAALSMCDMEKGKFRIPDACAPLSSSALYQAVRQNQGRLEISPEEVGDCLAALSQDHSHWNTWLSNRDKALLFCRAARLDIDKDQAILLHKKLAEILENFTNDLDHDLQALHQKMAHNAYAADSYLEKVVEQADSFKSKLHTTFESVSEDAKEANAAVKSILNSSHDGMRMMRLMVQTMVQGNAEMAAEQELATTVSTKKVENRMSNLGQIVAETEATVMMMKDTLTELIPVVVGLYERQVALDQRSQAVLEAVTNATELLQGHAQNLEQASFKASQINDDLERVAVTVRTWSEKTGLDISTQDSVLRILTPIGSLFLGGYGLPATLARNAFLLCGGFVGAEAYIRLRDYLGLISFRISSEHGESTSLRITPVDLQSPLPESTPIRSSPLDIEVG